MTAILGAGVSGLSAAFYALENPKLASIVVLEASNRVGGWVRSREQPDGTIFEQGPRTIKIGGSHWKNTLELVEQLGLSNEIIPIRASNDAARNRIIYANNQLHVLPNSLKGVIKKNTLLNRSLLSVVWNDLKASKVSKDDETVHSFVERRLGRDVADTMISALVCGVFAGDAREISVRALMNNLFEWEQKHGSIVKGLILERIAKNKREKAEKKKSESTTTADASQTDAKSRRTLPTLVERSRREHWMMWTMKGGLGQLPKAVADNIAKRGVNIKLGHKCEQLKFHKDHAELIVNGDAQKYSRIISSLPARSLADLVQEQHPELSKELRAIPAVTVGIVNLQFPGKVLPINAFGVLVPPKEEVPILGIIFDSCVFPQNTDTTVLTVMMGGAWFEKYFGKCSSEEHLLTVAVNQVREILHVEEDPKAFNVTVLKDCIPQYIVGHMQRLARINNYIRTHKIPLRLCGSSYEGPGLNDVILSAKQAACYID